MNDTPAPASQVEQLTSLLKHFRTGMLVTRDDDGSLVSRPMTPLGDFDGALWFATEIDNQAVLQVRANPRVNVSFMHEGDNHYVSCAGSAEVVTDRAAIAARWSPVLNVFFKGGKDDPRVCMIRVQVESAEYWDGPGNVLTKLAFFATVAATGNHEALSDNARVEL